MTGVYAPFVYAGGGCWLKHHLLLIDAAGGLVSAQPFQGETERSIAYTGTVFPAFPEAVAKTPEDALAWFVDTFVKEEGVTVQALLERMFPHLVLVPGQPLILWNLESVFPEARTLDATAVLRRIYP